MNDPDETGVWWPRPDFSGTMNTGKLGNIRLTYAQEQAIVA